MFDAYMFVTKIWQIREKSELSREGFKHWINHVDRIETTNSHDNIGCWKSIWPLYSFSMRFSIVSKWKRLKRNWRYSPINGLIFKHFDRLARVHDRILKLIEHLLQLFRHFSKIAKVFRKSIDSSCNTFHFFFK